MSFTPLPRSLADRLGVLESGAVLELGCGDGRFLAVLADHGVAAVGLDHRGPSVGSAAAVVGDARRPPLRAGTWDLVLAPNLLRHLAPGGDLVETVSAWLRLLNPAGALYVLEDSPAGATAAERNYRLVQAFWAALDGRGPLWSPADLRRGLAGSRVVVKEDGELPNEYPLDAGVVAGLLVQGEPPPDSAAAQLAAAVARDGIACGGYWWARLGFAEETP